MAADYTLGVTQQEDHPTYVSIVERVDTSVNALGLVTSITGIPQETHPTGSLLGGGDGSGSARPGNGFLYPRRNG